MPGFCLNKDLHVAYISNFLKSKNKLLKNESNENTSVKESQESITTAVTGIFLNIKTKLQQSLEHNQISHSKTWLGGMVLFTLDVTGGFLKHFNTLRLSYLVKLNNS